MVNASKTPSKGRTRKTTVFKKTTTDKKAIPKTKLLRLQEKTPLRLAQKKNAIN
jgi:hypothetical protein